MKTIQKPSRLVSQVLGAPKAGEVPYRLTRHCVKAPSPDGTLFYNTLTGELLLLEEGELSSPSVLENLKEKHFYVPESLDENSLAENVRLVVSTVRARNRHVTGYTILTTTDCNARCFYCYEAGMRRVSMTPQTAARTAEHIIAACGGNKINIHWFGGEPLYNKGVISLICDRLKTAGVEFTSIITSNGYLFDSDTARQAAESWHLVSAQITLDGTRDVYNRTKAYIYSDPDPFGRVLNNIDGLLAAGVAVQARLNYNKDNFEDLKSLVDLLGDRYAGHENLHAYPVALRDFEGGPDKSPKWEGESAAYHVLKDKLDGYGIGRKSELYKGFPSVRCMADNPECEVIHPDGKIAKCEHFDESLVIGSVYDDKKRDEKIVSAWKERIFFDGCEKCPLRPSCINLKMCPWSKFRCNPATQALRIRELQERMLNRYCSYKNGAADPEKK